MPRIVRPKGFKKLEETAKNPFLPTLVIPVTKRPVIKRGKDGKIEDDTVDLDSQPYIKLFINPVLKKELQMMRGKTGVLFLWITHNINRSKDYIWINRVRCMKELGIKSHDTFRSGIADLVDMGIINSTSIKDTYWINPAIFFIGSRINKFPDNVKVVGEIDTYKNF